MVRNLRNVILSSHEIELISFLYTLGVIIAYITGIKSYILLSILPVVILLCKNHYYVFIICGIFAYCSYSFNSIELNFHENFIQLNKNLCNFMDTIPMRNIGMTKAFLLGNKEGLSHDIITSFRNAGAAHLLALSGLHMGIIYLIVEKTLKPVIRNKYLKYFIIVSFAAVFALMTGARPSIIRAFLFICVRETYHILDKKAILSKTLSIALLIQLIICPTYIESVGFQLSYSAVLGIMLLCPVFEKMLVTKGILNKVWSLISVSISCQLFTAPLAWYYFHSFPKYFLLTNLIAIPFTTAFMVGSIIVIILSSIGICPVFLCTFVDYIGDIILYSLKIIEML